VPRAVRFTGFKLDRKGVNEILHTEFADETREAAEKMAAAARSAMAHHPPEQGVEVTEHESADRTYHEVTIRDARGQYYARVEGVLAKAAHEAGLEVREQ
jgi:alpha-D-ribose 1-methylphosphonate 5-triphosphate diphosphatase PhnM